MAESLVVLRSGFCFELLEQLVCPIIVKLTIIKIRISFIFMGVIFYFT